MSSKVAVPAKEPEGITETGALLAGLTELSQRAAHDMVGPLNQAGSLLALFIKRYRGKIDSDADQLLEFLQSASVRMEGVINGVRGFMETVGKRPARVDAATDDILAATLDRLQLQLADSGAAVTSDPLPHVYADRAQIAFVFEELIGNAIKFRNREQPAHIHVSGNLTGGMLAVTVQDNGIGIDPEQYDAIFLPFKRLNGREYPGAGLGLAAVKTIVEMHGGAVRVVPLEAGHDGTTLEFTVPLA